LREGDAAPRAAAEALLRGRLLKERDYNVRAELESALGFKVTLATEMSKPTVANRPDNHNPTYDHSERDTGSTESSARPELHQTDQQPGGLTQLPGFPSKRRRIAVCAIGGMLA